MYTDTLGWSTEVRVPRLSEIWAHVSYGSDRNMLLNTFLPKTNPKPKFCHHYLKSFFRRSIMSIVSSNIIAAPKVPKLSDALFISLKPPINKYDIYDQRKIFPTNTNSVKEYTITN